MQLDSVTVAHSTPKHGFSFSIPSGIATTNTGVMLNASTPAVSLPCRKAATSTIKTAQVISLPMGEVFSSANSTIEGSFGFCGFCEIAMNMPPFDPVTVLRLLEAMSQNPPLQCCAGGSAPGSESAYDDADEPDDNEPPVVFDPSQHLPNMFTRVDPLMAQCGALAFHDQTCWFLYKHARWGPTNDIIVEIKRIIPTLNIIQPQFIARYNALEKRFAHLHNKLYQVTIVDALPYPVEFYNEADSVMEPPQFVTPTGAGNSLGATSLSSAATGDVQMCM